MAAIMTVLLIAIGVAGRDVTPNAAQLSAASPTTSGSPNP